MAQADVETALPGVFSLAGRPDQQAWARADRLVVLAGLEEAMVERPPVVGQRRQARGVLAGGQVMGGEAGPTPLVLQFVERVFRVTPFSIQGGEGEPLIRQAGHQELVFVNDGLAEGRVGAAEEQALRGLLPGEAAAGAGALVVEGPTQDHHAALQTPAREE